MNDIKKNTKNVWGASPAGTTSSSAKPKTKEFFEEAYKFRSEYEQPWLFDLIPFKELEDKKVLELGCGVGFDAYNFLKEGVLYTGIDITPENIERTRMHLEFYGLSGEIVEGDVENLNFDDNTFDVIYSNGVLHHVPDINKALEESYRVLKDKGNIYITVYNKNSYVHWISIYLIRHILLFGFVRKSYQDRLSMVEYTTSNAKPLVNVYTKKQLKKLLENTGFVVSSKDIYIRKFVKSDLPNIPIIRRIWNYIPIKVLNYIGSKVGWYIIIKGKK